MNGGGEFNSIFLYHNQVHTRLHSLLVAESLACYRTGHHFAHRDRRHSLWVVGARLCRRDRSRMVLVAGAAVVHMGLLAVVSVVRSLRGYNSHPVVHEVIVHGCSRAGYNREAVLEADRSSQLAL